MNIRMLALGLLLAASPAFAADVDGTALAIKDGKIDGNKISFAVDVSMDFRGMPIEIAAKKARAGGAARAALFNDRCDAALGEPRFDLVAGL